MNDPNKLKCFITQAKRLSSDKRHSLSGAFVSYKELWICTQIPHGYLPEVQSFDTTSLVLGIILYYLIKYHLKSNKTKKLTLTIDIYEWTIQYCLNSFFIATTIEILCHYPVLKTVKTLIACHEVILMLTLE
jgi:hypothetical protein